MRLAARCRCQVAVLNLPALSDDTLEALGQRPPDKIHVRAHTRRHRQQQQHGPHEIALALVVPVSEQANEARLLDRSGSKKRPGTVLPSCITAPMPILKPSTPRLRHALRSAMQVLHSMQPEEGWE